jgi:hypothetical protein
MRSGKAVALALAVALVTGCVTTSEPAGTVRRAEEGCPPLDLFQKALCVCDDLADVGKIDIGPYRQGPYGMNYPYEDAGGSVGVNGASHHTALVGVSGSWDTGGGMTTTGDFIVGQDMTTPASVSYQGALRVHGDLSVGGTISGTGQLIVEGALCTDGDVDSRGMQRVASEGPYVAPAGLPCPCDPATFFDVAAAVESARADNDNDAQGVPQDIALVPGDELELPTGRYFFTNLESQGKVRVNVTGTVAIYLAGSLDTVGYANFHLADGAQLDLFVSGTIHTVGHVDMAQEGYHGAAQGWPSSRFRLYLGGSEPVMMLTGNEFWGGSIYAPTASLDYAGHLMVNGSVFVKSFVGSGHLEIYGGLQLPPDSCPAASDDPDDGDTPVVPGDPDNPDDSTPPAIPGDPDVPDQSTTPDEPQKVDCYGDPNNPVCVG